VKEAGTDSSRRSPSPAAIPPPTRVRARSVEIPTGSAMCVISTARLSLTTFRPEKVSTIDSSEGVLVRVAYVAQAAHRVLSGIREREIPDDWRTFNARRMLGGSLLGQKKYTEAEPLLLAGYEGMKQREVNIPLKRKVRLSEAPQRLVQLYQATQRPDQAAVQASGAPVGAP
jgi:hypothetical protein